MLSACDIHYEKQNMRSFCFWLITLIVGIIIFCVIVPFTAFPISGNEVIDSENQVILLSKYNNSYDFSNCEIVDVETLPYSMMFLLRDAEADEMLLLQAEKYAIYTRYRLIFNPQPIYTDRIDTRDDLFYKIDVTLSGSKLTAEQRFSPSPHIILFSLCGLGCSFSLFRAMRKLLSVSSLQKEKKEM